MKVVTTIILTEKSDGKKTSEATEKLALSEEESTLEEEARLERGYAYEYGEYYDYDYDYERGRGYDYEEYEYYYYDYDYERGRGYDYEEYEYYYYDYDYERGRGYDYYDYYYYYVDEAPISRGCEMTKKHIREGSEKTSEVSLVLEDHGTTSCVKGTSFVEDGIRTHPDTALEEIETCEGVLEHIGCSRATGLKSKEDKSVEPPGSVQRPRGNSDPR